MAQQCLHIEDHLKLGFQLGVEDLKHCSHELLLVNVLIFVFVYYLEQSFAQDARQVDVL